MRQRMVALACYSNKNHHDQASHLDACQRALHFFKNECLNQLTKCGYVVNSIASVVRTGISALQLPQFSQIFPGVCLCKRLQAAPADCAGLFSVSFWCRLVGDA
jgi:hypothetical protein